jgi:23S rRNA pseudouridine2457 synthase
MYHRHFIIHKPWGMISHSEISRKAEGKKKLLEIYDFPKWNHGIGFRMLHPAAYFY